MVPELLLHHRTELVDLSVIMDTVRHHAICITHHASYIMYHAARLCHVGPLSYSPTRTHTAVTSPHVVTSHHALTQPTEPHRATRSHIRRVVLAGASVRQLHTTLYCLRHTTRRHKCGHCTVTTSAGCATQHVALTLTQLKKLWSKYNLHSVRLLTAERLTSDNDKALDSITIRSQTPPCTSSTGSNRSDTVIAPYAADAPIATLRSQDYQPYGVVAFMLFCKL